MSPKEAASEVRPVSGFLSSAIANAVVRRIAETTGRGPTKARTTLGGDSIFVVVQDALTKGEQALVQAGDAPAVLRMRAAWQNVMHDGLVNDIEELTGRRVVGFMSANHIDPDIGVETFILEPDGDAHGNRRDGFARPPAGPASDTG